MSKSIFIVFSVCFIILTIFLSLFITPESFYGWLIFVLFVILLPIILHKIFKLEQKIILLIQGCIFYIMLVPAYNHVFSPDNYYMVASTKSPQKANEIQEFLTTPTRRTHRIIVLNEDNQFPKIGIAIDDQGKKNNYKIMLDLFSSDIVDDSVEMCVNGKYSKNRKKVLSRVSKELQNIIYNIDGVTSVFVYIELPENINDKNAKIKYVSVDYETEKTADSKKIRKLIEKLIIPVFKEDNAEVEIKINDLTFSGVRFELFEKAQREFEKKNYEGTIKLLKKADSIEPGVFSNSIKNINRIIELNKKFKNSNNYKYYIELGDLHNPPGGAYDVSNYPEAVKNYKKALKLNPDAIEVYEKIGDAYYEMTFSFFYVRLSADDVDMFRQMAVESYLKSVEFGAGNTSIYSRLGNFYRQKKDYSKSLEYYNKVDTCDIDKYCKEDLSNKKVYLNWKLGNLKEAYKETKNCSVWICKLLRFNFGK